MTLKIVLWAILSLAVIMVGVIIFDSNRFVMKEYTIKSPKLTKDHDFLFISDLHCKQYGKGNKRLFEAIDKLSVDGAIITGDLITATPGHKTDVAEEFLTKLNERMKIYYSEGNHELRAKLYPEIYGDMYEKYIKKVHSLDLKILDNGKISVEDCDFYGLSISRELYLRKIKIKMPEDYVARKLGENDTSRFSVLLAHNPEYFNVYCNFKPDLVLSGHNHGGIARIPFWKGVISPRLKLFPEFDGGLYEYNGSKMILSRGIGCHSIPIRPFNPGELIVIHLKTE